jgi:hypothetical protein
MLLLAFGVLLISGTTYSLASSETLFDLVLPQEYEEALAAGDNPNHDLLPKSLGGPEITVVAPTVVKGAALESPVDIELKFVPGANSTVEMSTLKIYYLMFIKKDVTKRLLKHAEVGEDYIRASGAKLPGGSHKFLLEIKDSQNRKSVKKFVVKVRA